MGEVMVRSLINFVAIVCVLVVIDSDVKLLGIGGFCNAQEMDDNMVEQMWIGYLEELEKISDDFQTFSGWSSFPRKSLRDKKLWHKVLPPTSSASSPRAEAMLPIFTPPAPASSPLLSFEFPSLSPNEKRLLKSVLPLPIGHSPPISPHFIPPMPKSRPQKPKLHPPPMPRIHPHPMPKSQNHPMPKSPPQMPRSHPSMPRSHPPPMSRSHHPPMPRSPSPLRPRSHPPPMPRSHHPPIPRRHRPPMPRSPLRPRSHPPQMPRSHPLRSRSPPPPRPRSHPPLRPRSHHPPMPRSHPPPRPRSHHPPMPRSPPLRPRSPTPMPRHHHPPMPRSHHPPMPRSPPLRPKSPTPMPRSHHPPMLKSPPMPKIPPQIPKLPLPPTTSPPPMPKPPPPSPLPMAEAVLPIFTPASTPSVPASSPLKSVLPLPIVHPPPIRPPIIPPMPEGPPPMPESPPEMPIFPPPPMPKSPPSPLRPPPHNLPSPPKPQDYDHVPSKDDHEKKKTIVSAVAGGTVGGITLVALILVCFVKKRNKEGQELEQIDGTNGTNGTDGTNGIDDTNGIGEHVLNLSSVDHISAGAKQMPQSNENPPGNVKELNTSSTLDSPLVKPDMIDSHTSTSSAIETKTPELTEAKCASSLLPPPPRLSAQGPVQPPKCVQAPAPPKGGQPPAPPKSGQPPAPPKSGQPPAPPKGGQPPAPPKGGQPPAPPKGGRAPAPPKPLAPNIKGRSSGAGSESGDSGKAKLKPFFWDKVNASPNRTMVWHELKSGSFEVNEEKMESLFGYRMVDKNHNERKKKDVSPFDSTPHFIQIIEARKAQNLAILLKALNLTTEEVCDALKEGNELPSEFVQTLLKMAPTEDEELKLRLFTGNLSQLAPADRFMKVLVGIPFAFKRMESLLFMTIFQEEISSVKQSFATLEVASKELSNSRLFLKLLEAVLKTGNRMNVGTYRGGAEAFKLDTLLKLSDVKGTDGKTSLLHFVVQEISRSEGLKSARRLKQNMSLSSVRTEDCVEESSRKESAEYYQSLGLQVLSKLGDELENVKKAAIIDHDNLAQSVAKLKHSLSKARDFLDTDMKSVEGETEFKETLENFLKHAGEEITRQVEEEKRIMEMVKNTGDYFHGKTGKDEGTRLFVIVRDFLVALDKVCKEVEKLIKPANTTPGKGESQSARLRDIPQQLFPAFKPQLAGDGFSSDDESSSP
ncbi:formin-like protein 11 isoform X2 [Ipomoea triloba]|uniref:formin-like protein 11 isoform X2 n=1 Tax=Ipomoea triloba TaxID=35885 RepID=UPI00125D6416|nr:formin-like protein 11 isoform X2 [Ipomoea triloba]